MGWKEVQPSTVAAGQLWLPELTLDLLDRDWSLFGVPFDFEMDVATFTTTGSFTVRIVYPDSWALDTSHLATGELRLSLRFDMETVDTGGAGGTETMTVAFNSNSVQSAVVDVFDAKASYEIIRKYTGALPTGIQTETINVTLSHPTLTDGTVERAWGGGPDCRAYFTF